MICASVYHSNSLNDICIVQHEYRRKITQAACARKLRSHAYKLPSFSHLASLLPWRWLEHLVETSASWTPSIKLSTKESSLFIYSYCNWERCHFTNDICIIQHEDSMIIIQREYHSNKAINICICIILMLCNTDINVSIPMIQFS